MTKGSIPHPRLLMADDDADDLELMESAFREIGYNSPIKTFTDGISMLDYLLSEDGKSATLILLDLNMPKQDGKTILQKIKHHPELAHISVIVYSTSNAQQDILEAYQLGCSAYVVKPNCYTEIKKIAAGIKKLWFDARRLLSFRMSLANPVSAGIS
jgi:chemotaxis family two-component system response regulator Rcp1